MPETTDARRLLEMAEQAANVGDLGAADELLRHAARLQEAELGPLHPELANTLNNLAIVAEKAGRINDAEGCYRRAAAIAAAALPADHPMVVASRQNLEDFCHASGLPIDTTNVLTPTAHESELGLAAFAHESSVGVDAAGDAGHEHPEWAEEPAVDTRPASGTHAPPPPPPPPPTAAPAKAQAPARPVDPDVIGHPTPPAAAAATPTIRRGHSVLLWIVYAVVAVGTATALLLWQASSDSSAPTTTATSQPSPATQGPTQTPPPATSAPAPGSASPTAPPASPSGASPLAGSLPPAAGTPSEATLAPSATSSEGISLAAVDLCQSFSARGSAWRCDPAGDAVRPGALVLLTRVRSPRDTAVVHRWFRDDAPQLSAKLSIRANPSQGYRTYSRRTVGSGETWRVEVRTPSGELLHERRFTVQ